MSSAQGSSTKSMGSDQSSIRKFFFSNEFGLLFLIVVFATVFALLTTGFTSRFNLYALGRNISIDVVIGFSMMVVIVTGGLNLSVGSIGVSAVMFGGWLLEGMGSNLPVAFIFLLLGGALLGAINGVMVVRTGVHSFIITLATMSVYFGLMIWLTQAEAFRNLPPEVATFGRTKIYGYLSPLLLISLGVAILLAILYRYTSLGRNMLAAGANPTAAELSGVNVKRTFILCHALSGLLAALAATMLTCRTGAAIPSMTGHIGQDWLLPAFLAPVLGGTLLSGGKVSVLGTFFGAVLVSLLTNGLLLLQVSEFWVQAVLGALLLSAVLLEKLRNVVLLQNRFI